MLDFSKFLSEWPVVKEAPFTFIAAVVAALIILGPAIWIVVSWGKSAIADRKLAVVPHHLRRNIDFAGAP
jgi:hypothetical protein